MGSLVPREVQHNRAASRALDLELAAGGQVERCPQPVGLGELRIEVANPAEDLAAPVGQPRDESGRRVGTARSPRSADS